MGGRPSGVAGGDAAAGSSAKTLGCLLAAFPLIFGPFAHPRP